MIFTFPLLPFQSSGVTPSSGPNRLLEPLLFWAHSQRNQVGTPRFSVFYGPFKQALIRIFSFLRVSSQYQEMFSIQEPQGQNKTESQKHSLPGNPHCHAFLIIKEDNRNQGREHISKRHKTLYQNLKYQSSQARCLDTGIQVHR